MVANFHSNRFVVIGRAGLDLYADPPSVEIEDAKNFTSALGGSAANIAVALVKQGCCVSLLTSVSDDAVGRYTRKALAGYGVDVSHISTVGGEARNSLAVVETRAENCQSVIYRNNAADFLVTEADVKGVDFSAFGAITLTGTALAQEPSRSAAMLALRLARDAGLKLIIDVDYRPYSWASKQEAQRVCMEAVAQCDIVIANDVEFAVLADDGVALAEALSRQQDRVAIYKRGGDGCTVFSGGERFDVPVFSVKALKPTGAGDAFLGGLISGLVEGETLQKAVKRGAATAAIVVTRVGCAPAMPDASEVRAFMKRYER